MLAIWDLLPAAPDEWPRMSIALWVGCVFDKWGIGDIARGRMRNCELYEYITVGGTHLGFILDYQ